MPTVLIFLIFGLVSQISPLYACSIVIAVDHGKTIESLATPETNPEGGAREIHTAIAKEFDNEWSSFLTGTGYSPDSVCYVRSYALSDQEGPSGVKPYLTDKWVSWNKEFSFTWHKAFGVPRPDLTANWWVFFKVEENWITRRQGPKFSVKTCEVVNEKFVCGAARQFWDEESSDVIDWRLWRLLAEKNTPHIRSDGTIPRGAVKIAPGVSCASLQSNGPISCLIMPRQEQPSWTLTVDGREELLPKIFTRPIREKLLSISLIEPKTTEDRQVSFAKEQKFTSLDGMARQLVLNLLAIGSTTFEFKWLRDVFGSEASMTISCENEKCSYSAGGKIISLQDYRPLVIGPSSVHDISFPGCTADNLIKVSDHFWFIRRGIDKTTIRARSAQQVEFNCTLDDKNQFCDEVKEAEYKEIGLKRASSNDVCVCIPSNLLADMPAYYFEEKPSLILAKNSPKKSEPSRYYVIWKIPSVKVTPIPSDVLNTCTPRSEFNNQWICTGPISFIQGASLPICQNPCN